MQVAATGLVWMWVMLAGGSALPPLGPPLPLDALLSRIAPEDCLWYAASAGVGKPDPSSSNETERLIAEPQVQRFMAEVESQIMAAVRRAGGPNRTQRVAAAEAPTLVESVQRGYRFAGPVERVEPGDRLGM